MRIALTGEALIDFTASEAGNLAFLGHEGGSPLNTAVACSRLVQPFPMDIDPGSAYYLNRPRNTPVGTKLQAFMAWILEEAERNPFA